MADKIYTQLPTVHQTSALKNFFETTVEQLYSKANVINISGFVGSKTSDDHNVGGAFISEPTIDRSFYSLSPTVNTINLTTGQSENFLFYDELISIINTFGIDTKNQNKFFNSDYQTFIPPIDIDKFVNFQEYFWDPTIQANISAISQANPSIITTNGSHGFVTGTKVTVTDVTGMTEINNSVFYVRVLTDTSVELYTDNDFKTSANTESYTAYTSGGKITHTGGPDVIEISGNISSPIDIDTDIINKVSYTPPGSTTSFANGQIVKFTGNCVIPQSKVDIEFVVEGVGDSIQLVEKNLNFGNLFNPNLTEKNYYTIGRGSSNRNIWSRLNFWYHESLYTNDVPTRSARAERPILEFDKNIEIFNHGTNFRGKVDINAGSLKFESVNGSPEDQSIDGVTLANGTTIIFPLDSVDIAKHVYNVTISANVVSLSIATDPVTSSNFTLAVNDSVTVTQGSEHKGKDFYFKNTGLIEAQNKTTANQAPLFNLYNDQLKYLGDDTLYPENDFAGNKIFAHKIGTGSNDAEYGFPLSFKSFKSSSEIEYENFIDTVRYKYTAIGSTTATNQNGYYYYKLLKSTPEYHSYLKNSSGKSKQRILTKYELSIFDIDESKTKFYIGCNPNVDTNNSSGYDIKIKVNGKKRTDFSYVDDAYINFTSFNFKAGDLIDISVQSDTGLLSIDSISKYELPISWRGNPFNSDVSTLAEPEYLPHFKNYIENQNNFTGNVLSSNNFSNLEKDSAKADEIIQATQDTILGAFLLDDQEHNLVDAIRFNSREYSRYKSRFRKELTTYFNSVDITNFTNEFVLEKVLRSLISYSVGKKVFNQTYILPFGDNYKEEKFSIVDLAITDYTLTDYYNLDKIENSLLVYLDSGTSRTLLEVDSDYTIHSYNPITIRLSSSLSYSVGNTLVTKLYNEDRDSAQCPPTPSTMGLYPLYTPEVVSDSSFQTSQSLLIGHDGSRSLLFGDRRDDIVLEFEKRIYNSAKAEFRENNSLPDLNIGFVKPGAFRSVMFEQNDWNDLLNLNFSNWVTKNKVDPITNDFYDANDEWTWNYRGTGNLPGHWRGWYEYYYDTVRPHTHPWEMLGFAERPTWWINQYGADYSLSNTSLWNDLEQGIVRRGARQNLDSYTETEFNPFRRIGLKDFYPIDSAGNLRSPHDITSTGSTTRVLSYDNATANSSAGYVTTSFLETDGVNVSFDSNNVYVISQNISNYSNDKIGTLDGLYPIVKQELSYNIPRVDLTTNTAANVTTQPYGAVGVLINGLPLYNPKTSGSYNSDDVWHYDAGYQEKAGRLNGIISHTQSDGVIHTHVPTIDMSNTEVWGNSTTHSGIVGWAFDGLPIYGPYGYTDSANSSSAITNIKSSFKLKSGDRPSGPGGAHTGVFVEDYEHDASLTTAIGYADKFNHRYGPTPDSPNVAIDYYVVTIDDNNEPMFPYASGGGTETFGGSDYSYAGTYFGTVQDITNNAINNGYISSSATSGITSTANITQTSTSLISNTWKLGDGAPVENAWKYSEEYPFAVLEGLLLARPGKFATLFSDPTKLIKPTANKKQYLSSITRRKWNFKDKDDFSIHGDVDSLGNTITNIGYTQFINSWLKFQGLDVKNFADKLRTINIKLGHRLAGYIDKDTMILSLDQYSTTGSSTNLIIPDENITVDVHSSPFKTRNSYSGVIIEKTLNGYKVRGFDKTNGYFEYLPGDTRYERQNVSAGGEPIDYIDWQPNTAYDKNVYVLYEGTYYVSKSSVPSSAEFDVIFWTSLNSLPLVNAATGIYYQRDTGIVTRAYYETEYTTIQEVFDLLAGIGRYQESLGFDFGEYDADIGDVRNWLYSAKQFLFWTTGSWQVGNTLELSPLANKVSFEPPIGFVSQINKSQRNQFSIMDREGVAIDPSACDIVRENNVLTLMPPTNVEIYSITLFTIEIEHAMVLDNTTVFADTIYDPFLNQKQSRVKIKATKTANWNGRFLSEGFIIDGDELKPNLDNLAESMGRYHELGFVPVEKQVYETARSLYGFKERDFLNELDITDEQQFEFYKGMIQNKGTNTSLSRIGRSSSIVQGEMTVYDEWAIKVGDFGDLNNDQTVELKIEKKDVVQDPQLITLAFPEDTTGIIDRIDVLANTVNYYQTPFITIGAPSSGTQATAIATLNSNKKLESVSLTNQGTGYSVIPSVKIESSNTSIILKGNNATSSNAITTATEYGLVDSRTAWDIIWPSGVYVDYSNSTVTSNSSVATISANSSLRLANVQLTSNNQAIDNTYYTANSTAVNFSTGFFNLYGPSVGVSVVRVDPTISANTTNITGLGNLTITNNLNSNTATINLGSITSVTEIITAVNNDGNINSAITAKEISTTVNIDPTANVQYNASTKAYTGEPSNVNIFSTLTLSGSDFTLADDDAGVTLGKLLLSAGRYQPRRRYGFIVADNITDSNLGSLDYANVLQVSIEGTEISSSNFTLDPGDRWSITNTSGELTSGSIAFNLDTGIINSSTAFEGDNIANIEGVYEYIDVYVDGNKLENNVDVTVFEVPNTSAISFPDVTLLPNEKLSTTAVIEIVEKATIVLDESNVTNDIPGNTLRIISYGTDDVSVKLGLQRSYDITPDASDDEIILIDIDDTKRFLKKPLGVRDYKLWPNTSNVSSYGLTDSKFNPLPNSGYVNYNNVNFQAFDVPSISNLFDADVIYKPQTNDLIHVAKSENQDWNVYKLSQANTTLSFIEQRPGEDTTYLYSKGKSLFDYLDANLIGNNDNGRYLDYHLVIKDTDLVDQLVIWTNEEVVDKKHVSITNFGGVNMLEANISSIGPITSANTETDYNNSVTGISYIEKGASGFTAASATVLGNNTVRIDSQVYSLENGETVSFAAVDVVDTLYSTSNIEYVYANVTATVNSSSNVVAFPSPPAGVDADNLIYFSLYNNSQVAPIDLHAEEAALYASDANSTVSYINESNVVIPTGSAPLLGATSNSVTLSTIVNNQIKITGNVSGLEVNHSIRLVASNTEFNDTTWTISEVDSGNSFIIIESDNWIDEGDNLGIVDKSTIGLTGFNLQTVSNLHANSYTVSNVTLTSFTITDANVSANVDSANLTFTYYGKTKITTSADHNISSGDFVKLIAGPYSGYHYAEQVTNDSFVINVPYNANASANLSLANVITQGIEITTSADHGISANYVGKRIAVHLAEPRYYNQVYKVADVPSSNTIIVTQGFAFADQANVQTASVLTTLDHNKVRLNNADVVIDNVNNEKAVVSSFNRALDLRRGYIDDENGEFSMSIPMLKRIDSAFKQKGYDPLMEAGGSPYVENLTNTTGMQLVGKMVIDPMVELPRGFVKNGLVTSSKVNPSTIDGITNYNLSSSQIPLSKINSSPFNPTLLNNSLYDPTGKLMDINFGNVADNISLKGYTGAGKAKQIPLYHPMKKPVTRPAGLGTAFIGKPIIDPSKAIVQAAKKSCGPDACVSAPPPVNKGGNAPTTKYERTNYGGTVSVQSISGVGKGARRWTSQYSGYYRNTGQSSSQNSRTGATHGTIGIQPNALFGAVTWYDNGSRCSISTTLRFSKAGTFYIHAYQAGKGDFSGSTVSVSGAGSVKGKYVGKSGTYNGKGATLQFTVANDGDTVTISAVGKGGSNHWGSIAFHVSAREDTLNIQGPYRQVTTSSSTTPATSTVTGSAQTNNVGDIEFIQQSTTQWKVDDNWHFTPAGSGQIDLVFDNYSGADGYEIFQGPAKGQETTLVHSSRPGNLLKATGTEKQELLTQAKNVKGKSAGYSTNHMALRDYKESSISSRGLGVAYCGKLSWFHDASKGASIKIHVIKSSSVYRFMIKLPKSSPPIQNPNPGSPCNVAIYSPGYGTPTGGNQSPIYQPTGNPTTTSSGSGTGAGGAGSYGYGATGAGTSGGGGNRVDKALYQQNFGGFGLPAMAGYSFVPSVFKKTVKIASTPRYGSYQSLDNSIYVNSTSQRVTGGIKLPLAKPLTRKAQIGPKALRSVDLSTFPIFDDIIGNNSLNYYKNNNQISYQPRKIGSTIKLSDGRVISNVTDIIDLQDIIGGDNIVLSYPGSGVNMFRPVQQNTVEQTPLITIPSEDAPVDSNIQYANTPTVSITPMFRDEFGKLIPAGDPAVCTLSSPTPGYTMSIPDMLGIEPGDQIIINGTSITFPGSDPATIENSLKCSQHNGFTVMPTIKDRNKALRISSCTGAPLTIREGCKGGLYKEVLDFHVVRGFEQTVSETSNTATIPATVGYANGNSSVTPTAVYTLYDANGSVTGYSSGTIDTESGSVLSSRTETSTTGGSGYTVGDRLRVVGGVPIADPYGPITEICVDNPGTGYTEASNVKVYIGDGVSPGTGAIVGSVILNDTGGIHKVLLVSGGSGYDITRPPPVRIIDTGVGTSTIPATPATLTAKVTSGASLPPRVAKFLVTSVDSRGTITSLQIVDRGIYKQFPADLTQGVPLEYDVIGLGDETGYDENGNFFQGSGLGQYDPTNNNKQLESPGGYDPIRNLIGGGKGARVFLTAREIPDCSEKGDAKSRLGLPDQVMDTNIPEDMSACFNDALRRAGYDPNDIFFDTEDINDDITSLVLRSPGYDGVDIDELNPGFLDKLGIPKGTYDPDMLCMVASYSTSNVEPTRENRTTANTLANTQGYDTLLPLDTPSITITCVDKMGWDNYDNGFGNGIDNNSLFGDGNVTFTSDMYQYELRKLNGLPVNSMQSQQECTVHYLESMRFANVTQLNNYSRPDGNLSLSDYSNVWIDYDTNTTNKTNFITNGWSYYENGNAISWQTPMVDTEFVKNVILYDQETGDKDLDFHFWDPFKGVIPGFIERELTYICQNDPVVYNSARSVFGKKQVGQVWWDTSTIAYQWYEQGIDSLGNPNNRERWLNWGKAFPGSAINLYEWVESKQLPINYNGTGTPKNANDYIVSRVLDEKSGTYENYYYYWVFNKEDLSNEVISRLDRKWNTLTLAKYLADPVRYGLPLVSFVSDQSFVLTNVSQNLREDEQILQINLSRNLNPIGEKHTAWKLMRESDNNSTVPDDLGNKLIDSLCGENAIGQSVPDPLLSEVEAYGIKFRPRQSMFKNVKNARRVLHYTLNEILADLKLETNNPNWDSSLPAIRSYIETTNWFAIQRVNNSDNSNIRYDNTFKPIFNVGSVQELDSLTNLPDDTIVQVQAKLTDRYQLWEYNSNADNFNLISIQNDTVQLKPSIYLDDTNATLSNELRLLLVALRDNVFEGTNLWNKLFFALLRYSYIEQEQLDWAFKSTYIYIEKDEEDLIEFNGFKIDNFDKVLQYFDEVKPYTAKVRQYKDGKSPPRELISGNSVSDFDKPPYADPVTGNVRILDDKLASDVQILSTNNNYVKYHSISDKSQDPIRHMKYKMIFDRTNYSLAPMDYQAGYGNVVDISISSANNNVIENTTSNVSNPERANIAIARNIVNLMGMSNAQLHANIYTRAADRIFKMDPSVISSFTAEINSHFSITDGYTNANIISSVANITSIIDAGNLTTTLNLVKTKTGGDFQGEYLDANVFTRFVESVPDSEVASVFGFSSQPLEGIKFDEGIEIDNYEGVFTGTPTLVRDGISYDGFDGVTFQRVLYGEERPQELALLDPFESLIVKVNTSQYANNDSNANVVSSNASSVKYQIQYDLFGDTEYLRLLQDGSANTLLTANLLVTDTSISVANANVFIAPKSGTPGVIWVGDERIEFTRYGNGDVSSNVLSGLTRATKGTSLQNWYASDNIMVHDGSQNNIFSNVVYGVPGQQYEPTSNIWLDTGASSLADKGNVSSNVNSIMRFLHNL